MQSSVMWGTGPPAPSNGSQIPREADAVLYTRASPEIGEASTKTFLAQLTANYFVGLAWRRCPSR